jgi:hypothetical protein
MNNKRRIEELCKLAEFYPSAEWILNSIMCLLSNSVIIDKQALEKEFMVRTRDISIYDMIATKINVRLGFESETRVDTTNIDLIEQAIKMTKEKTINFMESLGSD